MPFRLQPYIPAKWSNGRLGPLAAHGAVVDPAYVILDYVIGYNPKEGIRLRAYAGHVAAYAL